MIHVRFMAVVVLAQLYKGDYQVCTLSYSQGNRHPWLVRIWNRRNMNSEQLIPIAHGALVSSDKVVSGCNCIKSVFHPQFSLTGYHYKADGTLKCEATVYFYKVTYHPECSNGQPDTDFSIWYLPYPFEMEGKPYLFPFRPSAHEFEVAIDDAADSNAYCELPLYTLNPELPATVMTSVRFMKLDQYRNSCGDGCVPWKSAKNVGVLYVGRDRGSTVWNFNRRDFHIGAVYVCEGFGLGIIGPVLNNPRSTDKLYRVISSFENILGVMGIAARPEWIETTKRTTTPRSSQSPETADSFAHIPKDNSSYAPASASFRVGLNTDKRRKRTPPFDIEDIGTFLKSRQHIGSNGERGLPPCMLLLLDVLVEWNFS